VEDVSEPSWYSWFYTGCWASIAETLASPVSVFNVSKVNNLKHNDSYLYLKLVTMKRILSLLMILGLAQVGFAQYGNSYPSRNDSRDVILGRQDDSRVYNDRRYDNNRNDYRDREERIRQINRDFDFRIAAVQRDRYLRNGEKRREVRRLEQERKEQIRMLNYRWNERYSRSGDRRY
jgi:hypothetical protein